MITYMTLTNTSYMGENLKESVTLMEQSSYGNYYSVQFSRLGKSFVFDYFYMSGIEKRGDEEVLRTLKDHLSYNYHIYLECKSFNDFCVRFGENSDYATYEQMYESGRILTDFFSDDEILNFSHYPFFKSLDSVSDFFLEEEVSNL